MSQTGGGGQEGEERGKHSIIGARAERDPAVRHTRIELCHPLPKVEHRLLHREACITSIHLHIKDVLSAKGAFLMR